MHSSPVIKVRMTPYRAKLDLGRGHALQVDAEGRWSIYRTASEQYRRDHNGTVTQLTGTQLSPCPRDQWAAIHETVAEAMTQAAQRLVETPDEALELNGPGADRQRLYDFLVRASHRGPIDVHSDHQCYNAIYAGAPPTPPPNRLNDPPQN